MSAVPICRLPARGVLHLLGSPVPRSVLLADDLLEPVFQHLRGRSSREDTAAGS